MNTFKRYITLVATLAITASFPLGAMKENQQKTTKIQLKNTFLLKATQHDVAYIKENIKIMPTKTLQIALDSLKGQEDSETYQIIATYLSQQPKIEKKRKRDDENDTTSQENKQEEIKKRKLQEEAFCNAAKDEKIGIIMQNYRNMSDEIISKAIDLVQESIKIKKEKKEIESDYESKVAQFLYRELNSREKIKMLENNTPKTDDLEKSTLKCGICLEEFNKEELEKNINVIKLNCNPNAPHYFHQDCINHWAKTEVMSKKIDKDSQQFICNCPVCKHEHLVKNFLTTEEIKTYSSFKNPNTEENAEESLNTILNSQDGIIGAQEVNQFCGHIIGKNYWGIVKKLISTNLLECLNADIIALIIMHASHQKQFETIEGLFSNKKTLEQIDQGSLSLALLIAAINDQLNIVQKLLNNDIVLRKLTKENLKSALNHAKTDEIKKEIEKHIKEINKWRCNIQ